MPAHTPAPTELIRYGPVRLEVVDLERSRRWWEELVGLRPRAAGDALELGVGGAPLAILREGATTPVRPGHSGLYHLAIHLPDRPSFARALERLIGSGHPVAAVDHVMSKSIYLRDPDGIGLELTLETPERAVSKRWNAARTALEIVDDTGRRRGPSSPLDVAAELALADGDGRHLPRRCRIGHVHLHVRDLAEAHAFYRDRLGFLESNYAPALGFADLGAGGAFEHRLAVNVWQGVGAPPRPRGAAGMESFAIEYRSDDRLRAALAAVDHRACGDGTFVAHDPSGNALVFAVARDSA